MRHGAPGESGGNRPHLHLSGVEPGHPRRRPVPGARLVHRRRRSKRGGQDHLEAGEIRWNGVSVADPARFLAFGRSAYIAQARTGSADVLYGEVTRALEGGVELLAVDDLSAVLDMRQERTLWDRLFWRWGACLAVSNRQPALSRADRIVVLHEGRTVGEGKLEELLHTCPEMQRIWRR